MGSGGSGEVGTGGDVGEWGNGEFQLKSEHPKTLTPQHLAQRARSDHPKTQPLSN
ncbi:conserved hypothetical protein [Microcystis sp. T1-4]|nr:conserved hypothetical protein [Microcystis sp. T1-4]